MDVVTIINELRRELERIDALILALESLQSGRRRGRPPKALQDLRAGRVPGNSPATKRAAQAVQEASENSKPKQRRKKAAKKKKAKKSSAS